MRKITTLLTAIILLANTIAFAESRTYKSSNGIFDYTSDGVVTAYYGDELVSVPSDIDGMPIRKIGDKLCFDLDISTVYMEDGIEEIGESAFEGCSATYVDIAASVRTVADRAFANCDCLTDVVLGSENVTFGYDVFMGTGYLNFTVPCTANLEMLTDKISDAKGGNDFGFSIMHNALVESMTEKDIFGENMFYCEDCGFKGSKYLEDISLPFSDVSDDAWYYPYVQTAYSFGIINGKSETIFDPNAGLTCAEAAKISASIHRLNRYDDDGMEFQPTGENWYDTYVDYCYAAGILEDYEVFDWNKNATRAQMAYLFSRCDTEPYYINEVPLTDIPDVDEATPFAYEILDLYNKGIAVGSNEYYAFYPDSEVKRSEAAALISRILCRDMRIELPKG